MVTVKPIVIPSNKRRDGSYLVFIRVYFNGRVRRIPTSVVCRPGDLTRGLRIKSQSVQEQAERIAKRMLDAVSGFTDEQLAGKDVDWVVERMRCADALHNFRLDFFQFADDVIGSKSEGGRCQYVTAINTFAEYLGKREIDINDITKPLLVGFLRWMDGKALFFCKAIFAVCSDNKCTSILASHFLGNPIGTIIHRVQLDINLKCFHLYLRIIFLWPYHN